jgi:hypothetical protein
MRTLMIRRGSGFSTADAGLSTPKSASGRTRASTLTSRYRPRPAGSRHHLGESTPPLTVFRPTLASPRSSAAPPLTDAGCWESRPSRRLL